MRAFAPTPAPRETLPSYVGRLAAYKGVTAQNLCYDMGVSIRRMLHHEPYALECLAKWGHLTDIQIEEMLSWTGRTCGDARMQFRGEIYISRSLRNPVVRGCPKCLWEDLTAPDQPLAETMVMRGDWLFREVSICLQHNHPLVALWDVPRSTDRYDIKKQMNFIHEKLLAKSLEQDLVEPSPYDLWLDRRLECGEDSTWLAETPLAAGAIICRYLGRELLRLRAQGVPPDADLTRVAQNEGFDILSKGPEAFRSALNQLAENADGFLDEPAKAFGKVYTYIANDRPEDTTLDAFRHILRDTILDIWPLGPGDEILGHKLKARKLHSVRSAVKQAGIKPDLMTKILIEHGAVSETDLRPDSRKTFPAQKFGWLVDAAADLVRPRAMRSILGATQSELAALEEERVLIPFVSDPDVRLRWRRKDGTVLLKKLTASASPIKPDDMDWEGFIQARKRGGFKIAELISFVKRGDLSVGLRGGEKAFRNIAFPRKELDVIRGARNSLVSGLVSVSEFGRSVGLRAGEIEKLVRAGHVEASTFVHPETGRDQLRMSSVGIAKFHRRFVTISTLARETGKHRNSIRTILRSGRVAPHVSRGESFGNVWLRKSVEHLFRGKPT